MTENDFDPMRPRAGSNQISARKSINANGGIQANAAGRRLSYGRRLSLVQRNMSCDLQENIAFSNSDHRSILRNEGVLRNGAVDSEYEYIENWLDDHPDFVTDYFVKKANYRLISAWLENRDRPLKASTGDIDTNASPNAKVAFAMDMLPQSPIESGSKYTVKAHDASWLTSRTDESLARLVAKADVRLRPSMRHSVSGMSVPCSRKVSLNSVAERPFWRSDYDSLTQNGAEAESSGNKLDDINPNRQDSRSLGMKSSAHSSETRSRYRTASDRERERERERERDRDRESAESNRFWCDLLVDLCASNDDVTRMSHRVALAICQLVSCESASLFTVAPYADGCDTDAEADADNDTDAEADANAKTTKSSREPTKLICRALNVHAHGQLKEHEEQTFETEQQPLSFLVGSEGGLIGLVAQTGQPIRLDDAYSDERFNRELDSVSGYRTHSVIIVPIKARDGQLIGIAVAANRLASTSTVSNAFQLNASVDKSQAQLQQQQQQQQQQMLSDSAADCVSVSVSNSRKLSTNLSEPDTTEHDHENVSSLAPSELAVIGDHRNSLAISSRKASSSQSDFGVRKLSGAIDGDGTTGTTANGRKCSQPEFSSRRPAPTEPSRSSGCHSERIFAPFAAEDETTLVRFVGVCALALRNAAYFEKSRLENRRSEVLLELARCIFREQVDLHTLIYKIITYAQTISRCERCQLLLIDDSNVKNHNDTKMGIFCQVYDLSTDSDSNASDADAPRFPICLAISEHVAKTGETVNVADVERDPRFGSQHADSGSSSTTAATSCSLRSVLCMPVRNGENEVIGVCVLANKLGAGVGEAAFERDDERFFEAFTIFCGLGIHQTKMYERAIRAVAKQRVALEVLSYHATASADEAQRLRKMNIPTARFYNLFDFAFCDFSLSDDDTLKCALRMFIDLRLVDTFRIDYGVLCRWLMSVKKNYRNVTYHNWRHALNVAQSMFAMLIKANDRLAGTLDERERLGLLVACLCHDLDHRGTNNQFQIKSDSALAQLYSTSVMEHHHFDQACMLLQAKGNEIFASLSPEDYTKVLGIIEKAILATDLALYFKFREGFFRLVGRRPVVETAPCPAPATDAEWQVDSNRNLLRSMLMTACDLSAIYKPWDVQKRVAELVFGEFFEQGDIERSELHLVPDDMMNRHKKDLLPAMQVGYIDAICMPLYDAFAYFHEAFTPLRDACVRNRQYWQSLAEVRSQRDREQRSTSPSPSPSLAATDRDAQLDT